MSMRYNPDEDRRFTLRLDDDLRETLTAEARRRFMECLRLVHARGATLPRQPRLAIRKFREGVRRR